MNDLAASSMPPAPGEDESRKESEEAEERSAPTGRVVYKAILSEGESELERTSSALFWSGLAAGLSMSFSMFGEGLLMTHLPDEPWRPLLAKFGYCFGFVAVILGRQQLFTENTLTPILPLLQHRNAKTLANVGRLWSIVLVANLIGAASIGAVAVLTPVFDPDVQQRFVEIGREELARSFGVTLLRGIFAGWLIALMVWLMPFAETSRLWVIIVVTYLVGLAGFAHIIAGAVAASAAAAAGEARLGTLILDWAVPCLIGNIIGGVVLVTLLNHAQVVSGDANGDL
jgi:formate/nitrite transporter FocA (FNT family)